MTEEQEVCRNFRNNGTCRYGDRCRFEHSEGEPIQQVAAKPPGQCFKFAEPEGCAKGDRCRFMHGENDPRFDSEGRRDVSNEICNNYKRGRCALGDACLRQHVEPEAKAVEQNDAPRRPRRPRGPKMCRNWKENGDCPEGNDCRFKHGTDDDRFANQDESAPAPREKRAPKKKAKKPRGPCFEFKDSGSCERGDTCKFTHGENDTRFAAEEKGQESDEDRSSSRRRRRRAPREDASASSEPIDEECNNYKAGRCRFGDECRRKHVGEVSAVPVEKIDEICNNFQNGRCRFGDFCRRQHIAAN